MLVSRREYRALRERKKLMHSPIRRIVIVAALTIAAVAAAGTPAAIHDRAGIIGPGPFSVRATTQAGIIGPGPFQTYQTSRQPAANL